MYTISHDYYAILGVAKDATLEDIKGQYRKLMRMHHPDQYNGLKAKYEKDGDKLLLKILEKEIKEAEEFCKHLNEAFGVLTDPIKRRQYNEQVVEPEIESPKILIFPKTVSFGTLKKGDKKTSIFTIKNDGGPVATVNIDWQDKKPVWGDLIIEPDEKAVFPIKITVAVDTTGLSMGLRDKKIDVTVDGKVQTVGVLFSIPGSVPIRPRPTPTPKPKPTSTPDPTPPPPPAIPPLIVISQSNIDFGTIEQGKKQTAAFTIENKGGPVTGIDVSWKGSKPDWAQLIVEPDKVNTFPIKAYILVDTAVMPVGYKLENVIEVKCDY